MEQTPGKRILIWREYKGLTPAQMIKATGIKRSTLDSVEDPNGSKPSHDTLMKVVQAFPDISALWLLTGEGPMLRDGRTLTPAPTPVAAAEPAPDYTSAAGTIDAAVNTLLREQIADLKEDKARLIRENEELRGKSFGSPDAAGPDAPTPTPPRPVVAGFVLSVQHRVRRGSARLTD